jgi:hypothetical protein
MNDSRPAPPIEPADGAAPLSAPALGAVFNPYRLFRGAHVPMAVLSYTGLSPGAKLCYGLMKDMAGRQGYCWPAVRTIGSKLSVVPRQVERYLRELEMHGFIRSDLKPGKSSRYVFLWHPVFAEPSPTTPDISVTTTPDISVTTTPDISVTQTPKGELHQLNSRSSSSPERFSSKVHSGGQAKGKKRRITATTTHTSENPLPQASEYSDPREWLRALYLTTVGQPIEVKLDRFVRETLELRGQDLAAFLEDIQPRLLRLSRRAGPGFWYRQAREFNSSISQLLPPALPEATVDHLADREKCEHCHCIRGKGMVIENGRATDCPVCVGGPGVAL